MIVRVRRQESPESEPFWQAFDYGSCGRQTVAKVLDELNYRDDLFDVEGTPARRIRWERSCMQKMCGACAIVINGWPGLACSEFVDTDALPELVLEPLTKFPVVSDLVVDRSCIAEHLKQAEIFLGERGDVDPRELGRQYEVAKCLKCGLCLEVCPNYTGPDGTFFGAPLANEAYLWHSSGASRADELRDQYRLHFARGCSKSLACRDICPVGMPTLSSIGYMNRA